jgi:exopolysaccharide biosynthesis polyprenyl glycosylphosphotransferase
MKKSELIFGAVLVPIDILALTAAALVAYFLRTNAYVQSVRPAVFVLDLPFVEYLQLVVMVSLAVVVVFAWQGLYAMQVTRRLVDELAHIAAGVSVGVMGVITFIFLRAELFQSRFIVLAAYVLAIIFVSLGRWAVRKLQLLMSRKGYGVYRVVLVGNGRYGRQLATMFSRQPELGYRVVGTPTVVNWGVLEKIYQQRGIDEIIQADPTLPEEDNLVLLDFCEKYKLGYKYVPDLLETYAAHVRFGHLGAIPLMEIKRPLLEGWGRTAKRMMDLFGALVGLVFLGSPLAIVAIFLKLDSPGPVFYRQTRLGRNMKPFEIFKFRSMKLEYSTGKKYGGQKADEYEQELRKNNERREGPLFKMKEDPRITKVGRILRRTRIDELPQLINVWRGEMSLLGPRPHLPQEVEKYDKYHRKLFTIKPGMSGMAQVHGNAGLPFEQEAKLDIGYIENWSIWLDVVLLMRTFKILFTDKNAV